MTESVSPALPASNSRSAHPGWLLQGTVALVLAAVVLLVPVPTGHALSWTAAKEFKAGSAPNMLTSGDFDADGRVDLAGAAYTSNSASLLLGGGNGNLRQPADSVNSAVQCSSDIESADFNNDGDLDIVVSCPATSDLRVRLGNGTGIGSQFTALPPISIAPDAGARGLAVGDFDDDGNQDIAVTTASNSVRVLLNDGQAAFTAQPAVALVAGASPRAIEPGDFNSDGLVDLVVANTGTASIATLSGLGNGSFAPAFSISVNSDPTSLGSGDFNTDGRLDLIVGYSSVGSFSFIASNGPNLAPRVNFVASASPAGIGIGDINSDGALDVVTGNAYQLRVSLGDGAGSFVAGNAPTVTSGQLIRDLELVDLNADQKLDIVYGRIAGGSQAGITRILNASSPLAVAAPTPTFDDTEVGHVSSSVSIELRNIGDAPLHVGKVTTAWFGADDFLIYDDKCTGQVVLAQQSCAMRARFAPLSEGERVATVSFASDGSTLPVETTLKGTALAAKPGGQGPQGEPGVAGTQGTAGADGAPGPAGADGQSGPQGAPGEKGESGAAGLDGAPGADGARGADGAQGSAGRDGQDGAPGASGVSQQQIGAPKATVTVLNIAKFTVDRGGVLRGSRLKFAVGGANTKQLVIEVREQKRHGTGRVVARAAGIIVNARARVLTLKLNRLGRRLSKRGGGKLAVTVVGYSRSGAAVSVVASS